MFGNPRGHLISTIRGGNNSIFSVLKVGFWLKGSYVRICGSSEIGPRMTVLTLRAKLKLYVGQFRPGGALSGTAEINVLKRLGVHVEILLPFGNSRWTCLDFCLWLAFWLGFIQKYSALLCRPKRCGSGGLETCGCIFAHRDPSQVLTCFSRKACWDTYRWPWISRGYRKKKKKMLL